MKEKGFLPANALLDGVFGPATREAIGNWQRSNGQTSTGFGSAALLADLQGSTPAAPAATANITANAQQLTTEQLLAAERQANSDCQGKPGGSKESEDGCAERERLGKLLNVRGLCWGPSNVIEADKFISCSAQARSKRGHQNPPRCVADMDNDCGAVEDPRTEVNPSIGEQCPESAEQLDYEWKECQSIRDAERAIDRRAREPAKYEAQSASDGAVSPPSILDRAKGKPMSARP